MILHKMRLNANNLFTFAKAFPLVHKKRNEVVPVDETKRCDFNMRPILKERLGAVGKQFKTKFEILTPKFLKEVAKEGTRVLHLSSELYEHNKLWIEGKYGIAEEINIRQLEQMLEKIAP